MTNQPEYGPSRNVACADGNHDDCPGEVMVRFPEVSSNPAALCPCPCHKEPSPTLPTMFRGTWNARDEYGNPDTYVGFVGR